MNKEKVFPEDLLKWTIISIDETSVFIGNEK
jgi:hypothetical protein